jgi:succinyl-diaminopimelate desuccinylase
MNRMPSTRPVRDALLGDLGRRHAELIALCARLIRIPSENPPGNTARLAAFIARYLGRRGIAVRTYEPRRGMPNLVATLGRGRPRLVLGAHLDVFPAGGGWTVPPFSGRIQRGRLHGRGAGDMKAGLAAAMFVASLIKEHGVRLIGALTLALASDEETGGEWGTEWLLREVDAVRGDACLIGESSGLGVIGAGEKGILWLRVRCRGRPGHAAYVQGESATTKVLRALELITRLSGRAVRAPHDVARLLVNQRPAVEALWGSGTARLAGTITVNIGRINGGTQINLIPAACEAEVDCRLPPGLGPRQLEREIRRGLAGSNVRGVGLEVLRSCHPYVTSPDERLMRLLRSNAVEMLGIDPLPVVRLGMTDGRLFRRAGIPTAVYGPRVTGMGGSDEYIEVRDLIDTARVHLGTALDFLGEG